MKKNCEHSEEECQACDRNRRRRDSLPFFLSDLFSKMKLRTTSKSQGINYKYYYGKELPNKIEFINKFIKDETFLKLHKNWLDNNCEYKLTPSIDRIDKNLDYQLNNLQFLTHSKNAGKDKEKLPILMYSLDGEFIKEWESKWAVHLALGIPNGNLVKVCYGERKSAGGYIWKFKQ